MARTAGVPAKRERGHSRAVAAHATAHRVRAMLDDVLELEAERRKGGRDWQKKLVDSYHESLDPLSWLIKFREAAGVKDLEPLALTEMAAGATISLAGVWAGAAAAAAAADRARATAGSAGSADSTTIDVTPSPSRPAPPAEDEPTDW